VTAWDCPRISREWLEAEQARLGPWWFGQEFECVFQEPVDAFFNAEAVARAFVPGRTLFPVSEAPDVA
jgi:hypothetical protein